jgi:SAM-dependent methyltransferase
MLGVDISRPLIDLARRRAASEGLSVSFELGDAQTRAFEPKSFDLVVSRFGVMFFEDTVAAFSNLRGSLRAGGGLRAIAFRSAAENAFMTAAERTAAPLLPDLPPRRAGAPGQFALADAERVTSILREAGWSAINVAPIDVPCTFPASELVGYFTRLGPVGQAVQHTDEATRARVIDTVRAAFAPFVHGAEVGFVAACWMISAIATPSAR